MSWTAARAKLASTVYRHPDDREAIAEARRQLAVARFEERIRAAVESAPPLPDDLQARLIEMIRAVRSTSGGASA